MLHSHRTTLLPLGILLLALAGCERSIVQPDTSLAFDGQAKSPVCHYDADANTYHLITIADPALDAHYAHGDALPGEFAPNHTGRFNAECAITSAIVLDPPSTNTTVYGGSNGGPDEINCPAGAVAVGLDGAWGYYTYHTGWRYWIGRVKLTCAELLGDGTLGTTSQTADFGDYTAFSTTNPFAESCAAGQMMVGGSGEYQSGIYVSQLGGKCGTLSRILTAAGGYDSSFGPFGSAISGYPATSFDAMCPAGTAVTGIVGRSGYLVDAVGFVCTPVVEKTL